MKLVFKNADFSANGIDMNIIDVIYENIELSSNLIGPVEEGDYMLTVIAKNASEEPWTIVNGSSLSGGTILTQESLSSTTQILKCYFHASAGNLYFAADDINTAGYVISLCKVNSIAKYSDIIAKWTASLENGVILDSTKTYILHVMPYFNGSISLYDYSSGYSEIENITVTSGESFTRTITGVAKLKFRTRLAGAHFGWYAVETE